MPLAPSRGEPPTEANQGRAVDRDGRAERAGGAACAFGAPTRCVAALSAGLVALAVLTGGTARAGEAKPEPAIARANHAGYARRRHCTAFAVAPRVVVTAAHCLADVDPAATDLLFGYARMAWVAHVSPIEGRDLGDDVAVLCLGEDAPAVLPVGPVPKRNAEVSVTGYGAPRVHVPTTHVCTVLARVDGDLLLDCPATHGASGGPVRDADGRAIAVMVATARASSLAAPLPQDIAEACR